tara:strand:- start:8048 stop:8869 length:822 start_codon:yes stop_codon:yes gene_type:complete
MAVKIIAEIGINHNGDLKVAKSLIDIAAVAGCDYVKFQKRTPDLCVPEEQKSKPKDTPWGHMTYLEYKHKIEFQYGEYAEIQHYCAAKGVKFFSSVWDIPSVDFMYAFSKIGKIPSALITNLDLCRHARDKFETLMISTGMSTEEEIEKCVEACKPDVIFHTNSTYPCPENELNLNYIKHLQNKYPDKNIGYSGHEFGLVTTMATVTMGVTHIERHVTLDRTMWGSDQMASVEPSGVLKLVRGIRNIEKALGEPSARVPYPGELEKRKSLRGS